MSRYLVYQNNSRYLHEHVVGFEHLLCHIQLSCSLLTFAITCVDLQMGSRRP